jgi:hypothetical protein
MTQRETLLSGSAPTEFGQLAGNARVSRDEADSSSLNPLSLGPACGGFRDMGGGSHVGDTHVGWNQQAAVTAT